MSADGRTRWGFHQLSDRWARRLVAGAGITPGDLVVDVGAGAGALTAALVDAGASVIAVELHPGRARALRSRFSRQAVVVVQADAADLRLPRRAFKVVSNPPFAATAALLRRLLAPGTRLRTADIILPVWVARRWASPTAPGAARWRQTFETTVALRLPSGAFRPAAPTATAVLRLERRSATDGAPNAPPGVAAGDASGDAPPVSAMLLAWPRSSSASTSGARGRGWRSRTSSTWKACPRPPAPAPWSSLAASSRLPPMPR